VSLAFRDIEASDSSSREAVRLEQLECGQHGERNASSVLS
jgi:hypothetical protein